MRETKIDLKHNVRQSVTELLNARLVDAIDLRTQLRQAHWNVRGPNFIALHEMFDKMGGETEGFIDELAERITALGGRANGTAEVVAAKSSLPKYPLEIHAGEDHLRALQAAYSTFAEAVRKAIDTTDELGDADTADLFTGLSRALDKSLWFIEAHLPG